MFKLAFAVHGDDDDDDCDENDANNQCRHCASIVGPGKWFICLVLIVPDKRFLKQLTESLSERQDNCRPLCKSNHHL